MFVSWKFSVNDWPSIAGPTDGCQGSGLAVVACGTQHTLGLGRQPCGVAEGALGAGNGRGRAHGAVVARPALQHDKELE